MIDITVHIHDEHAPAFRAAVEELATELGGRTEGRHPFAVERALTQAVCAVNALKAAVCKRVPAADPDYRSRIR